MIKRINKNTKIGLIGCGYWGTIIVNSLIEMGYTNISIYDKNQKNSLILQKKFKNLKILRKLNDLILDKSINPVMIVTPPKFNDLIVTKCIKAGKNIFLEKPGFKSANKIKKIQKLAKRKKVIIMLGYVYCYNNYISKIKNIIKKNQLGKILYINFQRKNLGPIRNDFDSSYDLASHDLSILLYFFDKLEINQIKKNKYNILKKNIADISSLNFNINNIHVDINVSWLYPMKVRTITIIGSKKMLLFDEMNLNNQLKIFNKYASYPNLEKFDKKFLKQKAKIYLGKSKMLNIKSNSPLKNEINYFFKCVNLYKKPLTDANFGHKILKILDRI